MAASRDELMQLVRTLPEEPGVYQYFNKENQIIYVGKAKSLKNRVGSYFSSPAQLSRKTQKLVSEIARLEYVVVNTEYDALLLENNLIKQNQPKYNILLKDDKTYPYICITNERFPRVFATRNIDDKRHRYYGPYANVKTMNILLNMIGQLYRLRTCSLALTPENIEANKFKVCMEYHIKNCLGPCEGLQQEDDYQKDIQQILSILRGNLSVPKQFFKDQMTAAAEALEFEKAEYFKKRYELISQFQSKSLVASPNITDLEVYTIVSDETDAYVNYIKITDGCITQTHSVEIKKRMDETDEELLGFTILDMRQLYRSHSKRILTNVELSLELPGVQISTPQIGDMRQLLEVSLKNLFYFKKDREAAKLNIANTKSKNYTLLQLKSDLNLPTLPRHIECFDNSNLQGTNPVSSMVCFKDGKPSKADYRHFNVKTVIGPNDFDTMYEVVTRRYKRLLEEQQTLPDLIVIDGGKGQLSFAAQALKDLGIYGKIPVVGIAKRLEEIYYPEDKDPLHINKKSRSLELLQRVRNEAHRFAITFHRDQRSKNSIVSELDAIEGIGDKTKDKLLQHFKAVKHIKTATFTELSQVVGKAKAQLVFGYFADKQKA